MSRCARTHAVTVLGLNEQFIINCKSDGVFRITILPAVHGDLCRDRKYWLAFRFSNLQWSSQLIRLLLDLFKCTRSYPLSELPVLPSSFHLHVISVAKHKGYWQLIPLLQYMYFYGSIQISIRSLFFLFFLQLFSVKRCNYRKESRHYENYLTLEYS
jgi:hypothetical protein